MSVYSGSVQGHINPFTQIHKKVGFVCLEQNIDIYLVTLDASSWLKNRLHNL